MSYPVQTGPLLDTGVPSSGAGLHCQALPIFLNMCLTSENSLLSYNEPPKHWKLSLTPPHPIHFGPESLKTKAELELAHVPE